MCDPIKGFKLCTCVNEPVVHNKNSRRYKKQNPGKKPEVFKWQLLRYVKTEYSGEMGSVRMPSHDLGRGLTEQYVVQKLNEENCFDFDYTPQERDSLAIQVDDRWDFYLAFTFKNGQWMIGRDFDAFNDVMKELGEGKLKPIKEDSES
ncbi:MAG: hypothetical protein EOP48_11660 [Sphingobacteriales bacterium]|nr:MAG: hypothetical protein EOP48_11660 [Sphingobacteriales bacterium]